MIVGLFQKNPNRGDEGYTFFLKKKPGFFRFVTLPLEILDKKNFLYPWKFCKIVLHPLGIPRSKTKTHENSTKLSSWKFCKTV